jgi:dihydrofolate synthase/folylpolyglutamate synthase
LLEECAVDCAEALAYVNSLPRFSGPPGLERIRAFLAELGNPQDTTRHVHIAGTNGKGSVTAITASILTCAGYKTGMYISPHLEHFGERMLVNGWPATDAVQTELVSRLKPLAERFAARWGSGLAQFEFITAMAFCHFRDQDCDVASLEVGLGGRYDATNVIRPPLASVITSIGHDHTDILGNTLEAIAAEKAGIIKPRNRVVTAVRQAGALSVIAGIAANQDAQLWRVAPLPEGRVFSECLSPSSEPEILWRRNEYSVAGQTFDLELPCASYSGLRLRMLGPHQVDNAACAVGAIHALRGTGRVISEDAIRDGLLRATWPGRFEMLSRRPYVIIDGAHNPEGAQALAATFAELFPGKKATLVLGLLRDKHVRDVVAAVGPVARRVIATSPSHGGRALPAEELAAIVSDLDLPVEVLPVAGSAIKAGADSLETPDDILLVTGSLYLIGEARTALRRL